MIEQVIDYHHKLPNENQEDFVVDQHHQQAIYLASLLSSTVDLYRGEW